MKANFIIAPITAFMAVIAVLTLSSCSGGLEKANAYEQSISSGDKSFSFKEKGSDWKVDFKDDEISSVFRDGIRLPGDELNQHREMIYRKLNELKSEYEDFSDKFYGYQFDAEKFKKHMDGFKEDFDKDKSLHFRLEFDEQNFSRNMKELEEQLKKLNDKKIELYFDSGELKENMEELEEYLRNIPPPPRPPDIDVDICPDMEKFREGMKKFGESLKLHKFDIDSSLFDMRELKKNMKGLKIQAGGIKTEIRSLNKFLKELKSELIKDGYLNTEDEEYNLEIDLNGAEVNDSPVRDEDHKKYVEIYKKNFDGEIKGRIKINSE